MEKLIKSNIENFEKEKYKIVVENIEKEFLNTRLSLGDFFTKLRELNLIHSWNKESVSKNEQMLKDEGGHIDFSLCIGINENWGYIDFYYLRDLNNDLVINEISVSNE